jgi:hypothetical protein
VIQEFNVIKIIRLKVIVSMKLKIEWVKINAEIIVIVMEEEHVVQLDGVKELLDHYKLLILIRPKIINK